MLELSAGDYIEIVATRKSTVTEQATTIADASLFSIIYQDDVPTNSWLGGVGVPVTLPGINGDYYPNTDTEDAYSKSSNVWSFVTSITVPQGIQSETEAIDLASDTGRAGPPGVTGSQGEQGIEDPKGEPGTTL